MFRVCLSSIILLLFLLSPISTTIAQNAKPLDSFADLSSAQTTKDSLEILIPKLSDMYRQGALGELVQLAPVLEKMSIRIKNDTLQQKILIEQAFALRAMGQYELSLEKANAGIAISKDEDKFFVNFLNLKATALGQLGKTDSALTIFDKAIKIAAEKGFKRMEAASSNNQATFLQTLGKIDESIKAYEYSSKVGEELKDTSLIAMALSNIGLAFLYLKDYDQTEAYSIRAYQLAKEQRNIPNQITPLSNLGKQFQKADSIFSQIFALSKDINDPVKEMMIKHNYAKGLAKQGKNKQAIKLLSEVYDSAENLKILMGQMYASSTLSTIYVNENDFTKALFWNSRELDFARKVNDVVVIMEALKKRNQVYESQNLPSKAYPFLKELMNLKDSVFNENRESLLAEQRVKLETQQKQFEIEQLESETKIKNAQLETQQYVLIALLVITILAASLAISLFLFYINKRKHNDRLQILNQELNVQYKKFQEANQDKNVLLSLLAHDLQSPFSALRMLIDYIKVKFDDEKLKPIIDDIDQSLEIESSTVDHLLDWATKHNYSIEPELRPINLYELTHEVIQQQQRVAEIKKITLQNDCVDSYSVKADRNLLVAVLRNLLANAVKFSKSGSTVYISCKSELENIVVLIRDEGVGMSKLIQSNLLTKKGTSSKGTENEKGTGLGLSLSNEFIEKMHGSLTFTSEEGKGTCFYVNIPSV